MVPTYILMRSLKLLNKLAVLILPGAVSVYNMLVLKSAFEGVPGSIEESAKIDGASNLRIFWKIMLPVVLPSIAAVSLFLIVGFWNEYWGAMLYITRNDLKPLQLYLLDIVNFAMDTSNINTADALMALTDAPQAIRAATIIAATLPILLVYPFVQKYFVKGVMIGSVKE
ncbi:MAG TPA: carbohydrate ABC transporter permease [Clostridia bacterium]|nr:carbohydrate ABC transporter permease [Clostridia bacterium]